MGDHSKTSICNGGLGILGKEELVVDADGGAPQEYTHAAAAVSAYDRRLGRVLRSHNWNFAETLAIIDADATAPKFGYRYRYPLPTVPPCARVWTLDPALYGPNPSFKVRGGFIETDEAGPLRVIYIARITDPSLFDDAFAEAMSYAVAKEIAVAVLGSLEAADFFRKEAREEMSDAKTDDSQENPPPELDGGSWTVNRRFA